MVDIDKKRNGEKEVIVRDVMHQSSCSMWNGKCKFQPMQCITPKIITLSGRGMVTKSSESSDGVRA